MAAPVEFRTFTPENSRLDLQRRIANVSREHAEAILESCELLQRLHDCGVLALANGLLSSGTTVTAKVTDVVSSEPAVTALRLGLIFGNLATSIDANRVHQLIADPKSKPPSWWQILRLAFTKETRRTLGFTLGLLNVVGAAMGKRQDG
jgi:uncharacterized protein YjgD (DUF1641 family)